MGEDERSHFFDSVLKNDEKVFKIISNMIPKSSKMPFKRDPQNRSQKCSQHYCKMSKNCSSEGAGWGVTKSLFRAVFLLLGPSTTQDTPRSPPDLSKHPPRPKITVSTACFGPIRPLRWCFFWTSPLLLLCIYTNGVWLINWIAIIA